MGEEKKGNKPWHYFTEVISRDPFNDFIEIIHKMQQNYNK
jgi:hypothetical protein